MPMVDPPSRPRKAIVFSLARFRFFQRAPDVFRFAGSRQADEHVARHAERRNLTGKNFIESIIVACGSEKSAIARQTDRRVSAAIFA